MSILVVGAVAWMFTVPFDGGAWNVNAYAGRSPGGTDLVPVEVPPEPILGDKAEECVEFGPASIVFVGQIDAEGWFVPARADASTDSCFMALAERYAAGFRFNLRNTPASVTVNFDLNWRP